jgi:hypothetical protein
MLGIQSIVTIGIVIQRVQLINNAKKESAAAVTAAEGKKH